jgi:purine-cytosine permease-like protein
LATDVPASRAPRIGGVEVRSIDYAPLNERHGKVWSQGPLWFMSNAQIATLAVGTFSVAGAGNLIWSLIAIIAGAPIGTFFMAFRELCTTYGCAQLLRQQQPDSTKPGELHR